MRIFNVHVEVSEKLDRIQTDRPYVVTSNHQSLLDGAILAFAINRTLHFGITPRHAEDHWFTANVLKLAARLGLIRFTAIHSSRPYGLRAMLTSLHSGEVAMLFPEGRICNPFENVKPKLGAEWLANKGQCDLINVQIDGANKRWFIAPSGTELWSKITLRV